MGMVMLEASYSVCFNDMAAHVVAEVRFSWVFPWVFPLCLSNVNMCALTYILVV